MPAWLVAVLVMQSLVSRFGDLFVELDDLLVHDQQLLIRDLPPNSVALNPSIARAKQGTFVVFRFDRSSHRNQTDMMLGLVRLDEEFRVVGPMHVLDTRLLPWSRHTSEDPRLFFWNEKLYVAFNAEVVDGGFRHRGMHMARINMRQTAAGEEFWAQDIQHLEFSSLRHRDEKNWTPFVKNGSLHFIYRTNPPLVLRLSDKDQAHPHPCARLEKVSELEQAKDFAFGAMRGGTAAEISPDFDGDYLAFFHLRHRADWGSGQLLHYGIGAYTFSARQPHAITRLLPYPIQPGSMDRPHDRDHVEVAYPGGYVVDENVITVAYGRHDSQLRLLTLDRSLLVDELNRARTAVTEEEQCPESTVELRRSM